MIGYAQLTGGKVYSAKTAAEINQSCNEIGPKTFVGETDTDGDGFTDIEEMSGLIVSSNCKIVNTDYMKADTDDDGLMTMKKSMLNLRRSKFRANYEYKDNPNMDLNELLNNYLIKMNNKQRFSDFIYNITGSK